MSQRNGLQNLVPGLGLFRNYQSDWFKCDLTAGISVAAVAVPIGIAYAGSFGFPPEVGLYSTMLPMIAYALFGSSRLLIVGPDTAAVTLVAAAVAPLAGGDISRYVGLSAALSIIVGLFCIAGGLAGLGFIANFLARPILVGYLNGVALVIITGQLGKLFGYSVISAGFFRLSFNFLTKLGQTHLPTLVLGVSLIALIQVLKRTNPKVPATLVAIIVGIAAVALFDLERYGVAVIGRVPPGLPPFGVPSVASADLGNLVLAALGVMLVSFNSGMVTSRSFALKNGYDVNANQEFIGFGMANIASGLSQGFVVTGADSRTAVNDSVGGKTQVVGIVAAFVVLIVLLYLTGPLAYIPVAALAAVLVSAAIGLFNVQALRRLYHLSKPEFNSCVLTTLGVITIGVLPGVLVAVSFALLRLLAAASHPHDAILGTVEGREGFVDVEGNSEARQIPGIILYRFESSILFFNVGYLQNRVREVISRIPSSVKWFVLDMEPVNFCDTTGADVLEEMRADLKQKGIEFAVTRLRGQALVILERTGFIDRIGRQMAFSSNRTAVDMLQRIESAQP